MTEKKLRLTWKPERGGRCFVAFIGPWSLVAAPPEHLGASAWWTAATLYRSGSTPTLLEAQLAAEAAVEKTLADALFVLRPVTAEVTT